jgi:hypothetical protein
MAKMRGLLAAALMAALPAILSACSKPVPPVGKWEGGAERGGTLVAARVEILPGGGVRIMAPDITNVTGPRAQIELLRDRLASDLATNWDYVKPRPFDFDGKTFRKPGGIAPQMEWDKATNQMTVMLYIGANPAFPVTLRPVDGFHDSPFGSG